MQYRGGVRVELKSVTKAYPQGRLALRGIDLSVEPGEWLVLVGPSACGKTTTLRVIAGLETADSGIVHIGDRVVNQIPPWRRNVAMVFQRPALAPTCNVRQNLAFGQPRDIGTKFHKIAELLDISVEMDRFPHQLSGGQQQRVALGRALARPVPLYLLDEPLSHLDAPMRDQLRLRLRQWHERQPATVISVTHDPAEAWALGDRVAVMWAGQVLQIGSPAELYHRPRLGFVAKFFAQGPMSFFQVQLREIENLLQWTTTKWPHPVPLATNGIDKKEAMLGIRAEHVRIGEPGPWTMQVTQVDGTPKGSWVSGDIDGLHLTGWTERNVAAGEKVDVMIDWTKAYLFDVDTDETLYAPAG